MRELNIYLEGFFNNTGSGLNVILDKIIKGLRLSFIYNYLITGEIWNTDVIYRYWDNEIGSRIEISILSKTNDIYNIKMKFIRHSNPRVITKYVQRGYFVSNFKQKSTNIVVFDVDVDKMNDYIKDYESLI